MTTYCYKRRDFRLTEVYGSVVKPFIGECESNGNYRYF